MKIKSNNSQNLGRIDGQFVEKAAYVMWMFSIEACKVYRSEWWKQTDAIYRILVKNNVHCLFERVDQEAVNGFIQYRHLLNIILQLNAIYRIL